METKKIPPSGIGTSSAYGPTDFQCFNKDGLMSKCYPNVTEMLAKCEEAGWASGQRIISLSAFERCLREK